MITEVLSKETEIMESKVCEHHSGIDEQLKALQISDVKQWTAIEKLQNRLPLWATLFISFLTFLLGISLSNYIKWQAIYSFAGFCKWLFA